MKNILFVERLKLKRSKLWIIYLLGPLLGVSLAYTNFIKNYNLFMNPGDNPWVEAWTQVALFMGPFVLPIVVGIFAALVCRGGTCRRRLETASSLTSQTLRYLSGKVSDSGPHDIH
ncbi:ABC transporter permease [Bacillus velezensis]